MSAATVLLGLGMGLVLSIPPGPAGVVILQRSLRGERARAARAVAAFLAAELLALLVTLAFLEQLAWLTSLAWMKAAAGAYLIGFALVALLRAGAERGAADLSTAAVFRLSVLNPAVWSGAVSTLTVARSTCGAGLLPRALFVAAFELGGVAWYLCVILGGRLLPGRVRHHLVRAALLLIMATGAWLLAALVR